MFLASTPNTDYTLLEAAVTGLLGYAVVFLGLVLLMIVVMLLGKADINVTKHRVAWKENTFFHEFCSMVSKSTSHWSPDYTMSRDSSGK